MKIIDLKDRTIFVDDIIQIYTEKNYNPERYNIQTTNGTYIVSREDYIKVKNYLLSLNDEVEIIEEDKKIEKIIPTSLKGIDNLDEKIEIAHIDTISAIEKINEIIDHINKGDK